MNLRRHRKAVFIILGSAVAAIAIGLNVSWIVINWRASVQLVLGAILFAVVIAGVVLNTTFLVREIRRNEQHNNFINSVTHELKTPVASIRLYLETLQARQVDEAKRREFYGVMMEDTDRLLHTIEQVLKAGQASSFRHMTPEPVSLVDTIRQALDLARNRHRLPTEALSFENQLPPGTSDVVLGDAQDLRTALLNLLDNAVKYSGQDPHVNIELASGPKGQFLVNVHDTGIGIPKEELKNLFQRFHRVQNATTARIKGTGLGLFIVHTVAKRHKGKAFAHSDGSGQGSTFTLELPAAPKEAA
jgi:two-component system, OmpR family, sensor histidine kinase SenX3